ncbi:stalk domain-containing protein [Brevibacillus gelatini]|uniref:stalk domain-containing protein n=1 Tax=Brevibacillus gelatini TaxID=1655277 RepID=UPI001473EF6E|nr:stalk domain-containing protein [Brevibacillus gelatini]
MNLIEKEFFSFKKWADFLAGFLEAAVLLAGTPGLAKSLTQKVTARFANIQLVVNDQVVKTSAEPFIYNGNVYAPVATVANALGIKQKRDNRTPAVRCSTSTASPLSADSTRPHPLPG